MKDKKFKKRHQKTEPNKLPFATPKNKARKPATSREELNQVLGESKTSSTADRLATAVVNALVPSAYATPVEQPTAEDLSATIDVQITDAIRQKATELNNNPIEI